MEILEQNEGGATSVEGASKLLKRPMSACSHQSRKPTRKAMKPRRAETQRQPRRPRPSSSRLPWEPAGALIRPHAILGRRARRAP